MQKKRALKDVLKKKINLEDIVHVSFLSVEKHLSWLEDDGRAEEVSAPALKYSHIYVRITVMIFCGYICVYACASECIYI